MSNIYKADLNKIRQESLSDAFIHLEEQLSKLDINFCLMGAVARDLWASGIYDIALGRITLDLDLAVLIEDHSQYELLKENLIKTGRFYAVKVNKFALLFDHKIQIDILPFGGLNLEDHHLTQVVALTNSTNVFAEVYRNGTSQFEIEGQSFAVSTLTAIVLLKLIAYDDRPEIRSKDLNDIGNIVQHYHGIAGDDLFEDDFVDLLEIDILIIAAAQLLGRHIWLIIKRSSHLVERIMSILSNNNLSGLCTL